MSSSTAPRGYSSLHIALHWIIAALVVFQLIVHEDIESAWDARMEGGAEGGNPWVHIVLGVLILVLTAVRIVVRLRNGAPPHPAGQPAVLGIFANVVHGLFYLLLIITPLSGAVAWFAGVEAAADFHGTIRLAFLPLIALHILGALIQQYYFRSGVLTRMMKPAA